ncbi:MAG: efflux transporter outer membrane subunit [Oxalobacteraceae bacterium]|nr:MAG: efflux transporter outer membrane subunit [Oxalobacteraceae bacterium]
MALAALLLAGCATGPDYQKPALAMPAAWTTEAPWREGRPDDGAAKGRWWLRYGDPVLDGLQDRALENSPTLSLASARLTQAQSTLEAALASRYPQLGLNLRGTRQRISANRPLTNYNASNFATVQNDALASLSVNYETDLFGRVESSIAVAAAAAQQSGADLENVRLLLGADLATAYFNLRSVDTELDVVARSVALQRRALDLASSRHDLGAVSGLDVAQQQALLDTTLTQVDLLKRQRAQFEHALGTLTGAGAPLFALAPRAPDAALPQVPAVPVGVPSDLLERRPDVAAAERAVAAANAQIGIANAAFYPSITLGATLGTQSRALGTLFDAPSLLWSLGASLAQPLFDAGRIRANLAGAEAGYDATIANYRRVVLTAMQEVEDGITGMASLERAHAQAMRASDSAAKVLDLATARYEGGVASYLDLISAQQSLLNAQRQQAQLLGQRLLVSVFLVKALGGDLRAPGADLQAAPATAVRRAGS